MTDSTDALYMLERASHQNALLQHFGVTTWVHKSRQCISKSELSKLKERLVSGNAQVPDKPLIAEQANEPVEEQITEKQFLKEKSQIESPVDNVVNTVHIDSENKELVMDSAVNSQNMPDGNSFIETELPERIEQQIELKFKLHAIIFHNCIIVYDDTLLQTERNEFIELWHNLLKMLELQSKSVQGMSFQSGLIALTFPFIEDVSTQTMANARAAIMGWLQGILDTRQKKSGQSKFRVGVFAHSIDTQSAWQTVFDEDMLTCMGKKAGKDKIEQFVELITLPSLQELYQDWQKKRLLWQVLSSTN